jgi:hypothetical protein
MRICHQYFHRCGRNCFHHLCYHHFQNHCCQLICIKLLVMIFFSVLFYCVVSVWAYVTDRKWCSEATDSTYYIQSTTYMIGWFIVIRNDTMYWTGLPFWDDSLKLCEWGTSSMSEICDIFKTRGLLVLILPMPLCQQTRCTGLLAGWNRHCMDYIALPDFYLYAFGWWYAIVWH